MTLDRRSCNLPGKRDASRRLYTGTLLARDKALRHAWAFLHGGAWTIRQRTNAIYGARIRRRGMAFVSIGYGLAPVHIFPTGSSCLA